MRVVNQCILLFFLTALCFSITACESDEECDCDGNDTRTAVYEVSYCSSLAVPVSRPVGLAIDDNDYFWIMSGAHNASTHNLTCWDIFSGDILREFEYNNLTEVLGTGVGGIAWDGMSIWISVAGNVNKLVQIEPNTGDILKTLSSPSYLGPTDLSWDGTKLWISTGTGQIHNIDPTNGSRTRFLDKFTERDTGIAVKDGEVWVGNMFDTRLNIFDTSSKEVVDIIKDVLLDNGRLTFFRDQLAVLSYAGIDFYDIQRLDPN